MLRRLRVIVGAAHPGPALVVTLVSALLAAVSGLEPLRVVAFTIMMGANQLSIGWSNDAIDAERDRDAERHDKPVARGELTARTIMTLAISAASISVLVSLLLGPALALVHLVALAAGWAYNLGLKRTLAATACYLVHFGLLPVMVALAHGDPRPAAWWAIVMGAMLGLAAHFANVLPDLDDDRRHGIRSLPHVLGARGSGAVALAALAIAGLAGVLGPSDVSPLTIAGAGATVVLLVAGLIVIVRQPRSRALFRIIMLAALAAVVTLAGAASSLVV